MPTAFSLKVPETSVSRTVFSEVRSFDNRRITHKHRPPSGPRRNPGSLGGGPRCRKDRQVEAFRLLVLDYRQPDMVPRRGLLIELLHGGDVRALLGDGRCRVPELVKIKGKKN